MTETTTAIAEYRPVEVALEQLREQYGATIWVCDTPERLAAAKTARKEIRDWRQALEAERKKIKAPALARCNAIDTEAKRICAAILELETPVADAIKEVEDAKRREKEEAERREQKRIQKCRDEIDRIRAIPVPLTGSTAAELQVAVDELQALDLTWLEEFEGVALSARQTTAATLRDMWSAALEREKETERLAAERAELERVVAEQEAREAKERERRDAEDRERRAQLAAEERERRERMEREEQAHRERIATEEKAAKEAREKAEAEARAASEERERQERAREEQERRERLAKQRHLDARELLKTFVGQYGELEEFAGVLKAIESYFAELAEAAA